MRKTAALGSSCLQARCLPLTCNPDMWPRPKGSLPRAPRWWCEAPAARSMPSGRPYPLPAALDDALYDLQQVSGCLNLSQLYHHVRCSEKHAHQAAVAASHALAELQRATVQLRHSAENKRRAKRAKMLVRDMASCMAFMALPLIPSDTTTLCLRRCRWMRSSAAS